MTKQDRKPLQWLAMVLILVSLCTALYVNYQRIQVEQAYKTVGILVDYDEVDRLARAQGISFGDVARKCVKAGANGLVIRERILDDWVKAGEIMILSGNQLQLSLQGREFGTARASDYQNIDNQATYILTKNSALYQQIFAMLEVRKRHPQQLTVGDYRGIEIKFYASELASLGMGYPLEKLQQAADLGMMVIPRVRSWEPISEPSIALERAALFSIPNLAGIGFNDEKVPAAAQPQALADLAAALATLQVPLISFEFYEQEGFAGLAGLMDHQVIRAHAIADNEIKKYEMGQAVDRFRLATTERNIRLICLRFFGMEQPVINLDLNLEYIKAVKEGLLEEGFTLGIPGQLKVPALSFPIKFVLGLGVLAAGAWLLALVGAPVVKGKGLLPYSLVMAMGAVVWALFLLKLPVLAVKIAALAGAIVFPSLAALLIFKQDLAGIPRGRSILGAVKALLLFSLISLVGAMIMCALLRDVTFMLKLDSFVGVKLAHLIPLLLVPLALWLREGQSLDLLRKTADSPVKFWHLAVGGFILAALTLYILRTGNTGVSSVSSLELQFRQLLDTVLGVRPRTKEFVIGHPLMLILLYFGYRFQMFPLLLLGLIGQISLINTYAHLHTPLLVSLFRSFNGLWLGLILGIVGILLLQKAAKIGARVLKGKAEHE